jgi:hypothetical protein
MSALRAGAEGFLLKDPRPPKSCRLCALSLQEKRCSHRRSPARFSLILATTKRLIAVTSPPSALPHSPSGSGRCAIQLLLRYLYRRWEPKYLRNCWVIVDYMRTIHWEFGELEAPLIDWEEADALCPARGANFMLSPRYCGESRFFRRNPAQSSATNWGRAQGLVRDTWVLLSHQRPDFLEICKHIIIVRLDSCVSSQCSLSRLLPALPMESFKAIK